MHTQPEFAGDTAEERISSMRVYFENKFIENYAKWHKIMLALNEHMAEHLERNGVDPAVAEEFTYNEFCAQYIDYVGRFMAQNDGEYTDKMITHIVNCMVSERIPTSVAIELLDRAQREQDELRMEYGTEYADAELVEQVEEAEDDAREPAPVAAERPPGYIPEIWRVSLGASDEEPEGTLVPPADEPPL
jgi:hypothetical protein